MSRQFSDTKEIYDSPDSLTLRDYQIYVLEVTANVVDTGTLFTVFQICIQIYFRALLLNPYAESFAISKSWGKQSKAFERLVKIPPKT